MTRPDHNTYREWLNLDADGDLPREQRSELDAHLAACAECRAEREGLIAFAALLAKARIPVQADFHSRVMSALPSAGWESRSPRTWAFPAAVCALLAAVAGITMGTRGSHSSVLAALTAVAGMLRASAVAGLGLIEASWKGLGLAFSAALSSPMSLGAFGIFVLCLNLVLFSLLRRRRPASQGAVRREGERR